MGGFHACRLGSNLARGARSKGRRRAISVSLWVSLYVPPLRVSLYLC